MKDRRPGSDSELAGPVAQALLDTLPARTAVVDPHGVVLAVNHLWREVTPPFDDGDLDVGVGDNMIELFRAARGPSSAIAALFAGALEDVLAGRSPRWEASGDNRVEWWGRWHDAHIVGLRKPPGGAVISHTEVTDDIRTGLELDHWSRYDRLTGLPNRSTLMEHLDAALEDNDHLALILLDLDAFAVLNEAHGHDAGDELLRAVAERVRAGVGPHGRVTRFIGDTFVVIVDDAGAVDLEALVHDLRGLVSRPIQLAEQEVLLTATAAVTVAGDEHETAADLLRDASAALQRAKEAGRGQVVSAIPHEKLEEAERELRRALGKAEFRLVYQAELSLESGRVLGAEALLRWDHPTRGRLAPQDFIADAEVTGLIIPIGTWAIRQACRQAADWPMVIDSDPPLFVAVNLSARQLSDPDLPEIVADALADAKLPANRLCLEITESAVFERFDVAVTTLSRLRATGVLIALDDFGTGYSSLSYLRRLPVDILKIDRSFISRLVDDVRDRAIVEAVVSIARTFGLRVVAEGVESGEQLALLRRLGCDVAQGYDIGRPGEPGEVIELARAMARHPSSGRAKGPMRVVRGR